MRYMPLFGIVVLLIFIVSIQTAYSQSLKQHEIKKMFLEITVPSDWTIYESETEYWITLDSLDDKANIHIEMALSKFNDSKKEIEDYVRILEDEIIIKNQDLISISNITSHVITKEYENGYDEDRNNDKDMKVMTVSNGFTYDITYSSNKKNFEKYLPEVKTVLQSINISTPSNFKYSGMPVYTDPENRFTIQYHFAWDPIEKQNRFEDFDVRFSNRTSDIVPSGDLSFYKVVYDVDEEVSISIGEDIISGNLSDLVTRMVNNVESTFMNQGGKYIDIEERPKYTYSIDGFPAGSFVFSHQSEDDYFKSNDKVTLVITSIINGKTFTITYTSTPEHFDATLPLVNKMIDSITINKDTI